MRLDDHEGTLESGMRPATILRAGALGEFVALLVAAHAVTAAIAWPAGDPLSPSGWIMVLVGGWIVSRTFGCWSGQFVSVVGTLSAFAAVVWVAVTLGDVPVWLSKGPFSPHVIISVLSCLLLVDVCDLLWRWGWTMAEVRRRGFEKLRRVPLRVWGWGAAALFAIYMIAVPAADAVWQYLYPPADQSRVLEDMTFAEAVRLRTTELFTAVCAFAVGASVGSFLNVVVYRTPRRESLVRRRSACPKCGSKIEGRDNLPLLGWIQLHGKCRSCDQPISARYPLVEAFTGCLFLLFYFAELLSGGINLPERIPNHFAGVVWIIFYTKWDLVGLYLFHCLLLSSLLAWSLIRYDRERLPARSIVTTFAMVLIPLLIWPGLMLVSLSLPSGLAWSSDRLEAILSATAGAATGIISGLLVAWLLPRERNPMEREFVAGLALVGSMLGWQAALSVTALTLLIHLLQGLFTKTWRRHWPLTASLFVATIVQLLGWRAMATSVASWWPVVNVSGASLAVWAIVVVALLLGQRALRSTTEVAASVDSLASESTVRP